ncbi:MAG TPA: hypothetical protein VFX59_01935 [Polyangiales bacterium]|nr:hypothetical protein [Polyangiales bacterium]
MKVGIALTSVALAGCLAKARPERLPDGRQALRIECNYNFANCERKARRECHGDYERVGVGSKGCKDCGGWRDPLYPQRPKDNISTPEGDHVYRGVLYVRCK